MDHVFLYGYATGFENALAMDRKTKIDCFSSLSDDFKYLIQVIHVKIGEVRP